MSIRLWFVVVVLMMLMGVAPVLVSAQYVPPGITSLAWSPDGSQIAVTGPNGLLDIIDANTNQVVQSLSGLSETLFAVTWSPDGSKLATGGTGTDIYIWDINAEQIVATLTLHTGAILSLDWSPDGSQIASVAQDVYTLRIWDALNYQSVNEFTIGEIGQVAWSPDGSQIAALNYVARLLIIDPSIIIPARDFLNYHFGPFASVSAVAWSPDGSRIAIGDSLAGESFNLSVWAVTNQQELWSVNSAHSAEITALAWSSDDTLVSSAYDGNVSVWDANNGQNLQTIVTNNADYFTVATDPISGRVAYGEDTNSIQIFTPITLLSEQIEREVDTDPVADDANE